MIDTEDQIIITQRAISRGLTIKTYIEGIETLLCIDECSDPRVLSDDQCDDIFDELMAMKTSLEYGMKKIRSELRLLIKEDEIKRKKTTTEKT